LTDDRNDLEAGASRWARIARLTPARIALGRSGASLPTREILRFGLAHAQARDAVHAPFDPAAIAAAVEALGPATLIVESAAASREAYLLRPDLGRRLSAAARERLSAQAGTCDLAIVIADGLSAIAVERHGAALIAKLLPPLTRQGRSLGPVIVAALGRVALGDEIGALLGARMVLVLIGERPGLSSPDSLGAYLTFAPRVGLTDEARNCVSNIRPEGLTPGDAARRIAWLIEEAFRLSLTGIDLKDDSSSALLR
jgi:ethanolamine ammonia-lyase small subunit